MLHNLLQLQELNIGVLVLLRNSARDGRKGDKLDGLDLIE